MEKATLTNCLKAKLAHRTATPAEETRTPSRTWAFGNYYRMPSSWQFVIGVGEYQILYVGSGDGLTIGEVDDGDVAESVKRCHVRGSAVVEINYIVTLTSVDGIVAVMGVDVEDIVASTAKH
jgi:hypothetical protein